MRQFDTSLNKAKELIKFENDRINKIYSSIEQDQWEIKAIALIESIGDEWNKFISACPTDETLLKLEFLTFQVLGFIVRDREKLIKKPAPLAFWNQIAAQLQEFTKEKGLFSAETSLQIVENASTFIEQKLEQTEWLIQTPKRWNLKWDSKENLDIKVDFLTREIQDYQNKFIKIIDLFTLDRSPIGQEPFFWPRSLNALILLLKIAGIRKLKSPCIDLPDIRLTATLISDPNSCLTVLKHQLSTSEKGLEELRKQNSTLQLSIQQARAMAQSGNHRKAMEALKSVPPQFRLSQQREVLDLVAKINQRLTHIQAVLGKLQEMDLQKLDWSSISDFCEEIKETIHNDQLSGSDYEIEAAQLLNQIENYVKKHRTALLIRWSSIIGILLIFLAGLYFSRPSGKIRLDNKIDIFTANSQVSWSLYTDQGNLLQKGSGTTELTVPNQTLFLIVRQETRIALERILWEKNSYLKISQSELFSKPFVLLKILDTTGNNSLDPENYELQVDRIPIPSDIEGIYLTKGIHRFSITQQGQPEFNITQMISKQNETVTLSSPWVPVEFRANAEDLFVSINNSSKRLIPYRFFLPVGNHEAIFSDSRGDIRESRRIHIEGGTETTEELGVSSGILKIKVVPARSGLKLIINSITHSLQNGRRTLTLSTGEQRIQLFIDGKLSYEANVALRADEELERVINLAPGR